jgi:HD-GYP domain-containing protein (c-di-GMP phosphodiesterase class II)
MTQSDVGEIRLAEPLAALSLVSDMARGRPPEEAMRACLVATDLARSMGLSETATADVYYTTLLRSVGCTATSHEYAATFGGDDVAMRGRGDRLDVSAPPELLRFLWASSGGDGFGHARAFAMVLGRAREVSTIGARADCEVGARMARRFGLAAPVEQALLQVFERWDGKGQPNGAAADEIAAPARFAAMAYAVLAFDDGGPTAVRDVATRWSGRGLDPAIAAHVVDHLDRVIDAARHADPWAGVVAAEPAPVRHAAQSDLDEVIRAFADAVDLKTPYLHGHSSGVATLAAAAAPGLGLSAHDVTTIRRAGWLHDLGRAGIPTGIWEKPGPLTTPEWEQVRLHAYHTERILRRAPALAPLAAIAGMHHERIDGSGYHRGVPASLQDLPTRLLAAADVYQALTEDRPHRAARTREQAARTLESEPLDGDVVRAVIEAAGETSRVRRTRPAGITDREQQVIGWLVRGRSEKAIAAGLFISAATVHTHIAHIYAKAGVMTRAGLAMFAMEHDLVRPGEASSDDLEIH